MTFVRAGASRRGAVEAKATRTGSMGRMELGGKWERRPGR